jgi:hypothetical protein
MNPICELRPATPDVLTVIRSASRRGQNLQLDLRIIPS